MSYLLLFEPGFEFTTDVARPIVRQQAGLVPYPGFGQACGLQSIFQCIRHISGGHGRRQEVPAPTHHSGRDDLEHGEGFFVGKNLTVRKAILGHESKYMIEFEEYMDISDLPNTYNLWGDSKNPVAYKDIEEMEELLQVNFDSLEFKTAPGPRYALC